MKSKNIKNDNGLNEIYHQNGKLEKSILRKMEREMVYIRDGMIMDN